MMRGKSYAPNVYFMALFNVVSTSFFDISGFGWNVDGLLYQKIYTLLMVAHE